jgi:arginase
VAYAPKWLRRAGLLSAIQATGWLVRDSGDLAGLSSARISVGAALSENWRIARELRRRWSDSDLMINLGGDHGVGLGTIAATLMRFPEAGVIWVDAHGDLNTPQTSPTGNFHGMPLAAVLGLFRPQEMVSGAWSWEWVVPRLDPARLVLIGPRDLDEGERDLIERLGIRVYDARCVRRMGIRNVMAAAKEYLFARGSLPLHLSFDIDALDPSVAPSTGTPVLAGLSLLDGRTICQEAAATGQLVAMDLVEFNPAIRPEQAAVTAKVAIELITAALERPRAELMGVQQWRSQPTSFWA